MKHTVWGATGRYKWVRERVPFWKQRGYEICGYEESKHERLPFFPMMVKRYTLEQSQAERSRMMQAAFDNIGFGK